MVVNGWNYRMGGNKMSYQREGVETLAVIVAGLAIGWWIGTLIYNMWVILCGI